MFLYPTHVVQARTMQYVRSPTAHAIHTHHVHPQGGGVCPKLPLSLCPRLWDERHMPQHEEEDLAMWGDSGGAREHWGLWFLVGAVLLGMAAAPRSAAQMQGSAGRRTLAALGAGAAVAMYISVEFFQSQLLLQGVVAAATMFMALFLVLLQLPEPPKALPALLLLWGGCIPAALFFSTVLPLPPLPYDASRMYAEGGRSIDVERRQALRCAVVLVFTVEALVAALALKLGVTRSRQGKEGEGWGGDGVRVFVVIVVGMESGFAKTCSDVTLEQDKTTLCCYHIYIP